MTGCLPNMFNVMGSICRLTVRGGIHHGKAKTTVAPALAGNLELG